MVSARSQKRIRTPICLNLFLSMWVTLLIRPAASMALQSPVVQTVPSNAPSQSRSSKPTASSSICPYSKQLRIRDQSGTHQHFEYYVNGDVLTWDEHHACARAWGGNLTSVHSAAEGEYLARLISHDTGGGVLFLGGRRRSRALDFDDSGRAWEWSDGTAWRYTNWTAGEPDSRYGGVRRSDRVAAVAGTALWIDRPGNEPAAAIYKRMDGTKFARLKEIPRDEKDADAAAGLRSGSALLFWAVPAAIIAFFAALAMILWESRHKSSTKLKVSHSTPAGTSSASISNLSESSTTTLKVSNSTQISNSARESYFLPK